MLKLFLIGIIVGSGMILPGVSGAVLAISFGIYDYLIRCISIFPKLNKNDWSFLLLLTIGVIIGVLVIGNVLLYFYKTYQIYTNFIFIGLILGGLPIIFSQIEGDKIKLSNILAFTLSLIIGVTLFLLEKQNIVVSSLNLTNGISWYLLLFLSGFLYAVGKIIPGISSSFLLMLVGTYELFLNCIANPLSQSIVVYIFILLGLFLGIIILSKIVNYLLNNYSSITYSSVLGFIIGTIPVLYSKIYLNISGIICVIFMIVGFVISYLFACSKIKLQ